MKTFLLCLSLLLSSCSSTTQNGSHTESVSHDQKSEIKVTARHIRGLSHGGYHAIEIDFHNTKDRWQKIKNIRITDVSGIEKFSVVTESGLPKWKEFVSRSASPKLKSRLPGLTIDNFLLASPKAPISLPGKFKAERWVLIQKRGSISQIEIDATYIDSTVVHYDLKVE